MMRLFAATLAIFISAGTLPSAQEQGDVSVALGLSTLGANVEVAYAIDPNFRVRGALMGGFSVEESGTEGDTGTYDGEATLGGLAVLGDFYPMANGWRVSGGLFFSNTEIDALAEASADAPIEINGVDQVSGSVRTTAKFENTVAPMITTGYDLRFGDGWSFNSEVGVIFTGGVDLEATAGGAIDQSLINDDPEYQDALDDARDLTLFPYIGFAVSYQY
ncbi:hypothetical protein [Yoonia sediminilitoris]|uniref:Outer membrane protein n=1 Tax=Yoonia sediminilitoris TaxID=1286148 RepID=A0A2T6KA12_9RHOB|nr:hypothetical protein [Yoonia sediminilitoris]PUB11610.1 hypothetical protein C8N45_113129 [Yoonia sediminilitoris]RCW91810.1 hypothetical protein DFP92_113129 [Yoonia sediminilitoris]